MSRWARMFALFVVAGLVTSSCASTGGNVTPSAGSGVAAQPGSSSGATSGGISGGKQILIIEVMEGPLTSPIWNARNVGHDAAAKVLGAASKYLGEPTAVSDVNALVQLLRDVKGMKPDGVITTDNFPAAENAVIKDLTDSGIPVLITGGGVNEVGNVGAKGFIGRDYVDAGRTSGQQLNSLGCRRLLNVNLIPGGASYSDQITQGLLETFKGSATNAQLPVSYSNDAPAISGVVKALLLKDSAIDCVYSVGITLYAGMQAGYDGLGDRTTWLHAHSGLATGDPGSFADVANGTLAFTINQQPWFTGYMSFTELYAYIRYGVAVSRNLAIADQVVTKANAQQIVDNFKANGFY